MAYCKPIEEEYSHTEHSFLTRLSLCCLCLALKNFQVPGFALQVWFEPLTVRGSFSNWGTNTFWLLVPHRGNPPPLHTGGWALVQFQNWSRHWCLLSFSDADVCLLPLNTTTISATTHHSDCVKCPLISTRAFTSKVFKEKLQLNGCFWTQYLSTTSLYDPLTKCPWESVA